MTFVFTVSDARGLVIADGGTLDTYPKGGEQFYLSHTPAVVNTPGTPTWFHFYSRDLDLAILNA